MSENTTPHDGAQSQVEDNPGTSTETAAQRPSVPPPTEPPVPVAGQPTGDSTGLGTSPPGVQAGSRRQPAIAVPGKPEGEVDTRR